jgi:hypothetical protein
VPILSVAALIAMSLVSAYLSLSLGGSGSRRFTAVSPGAVVEVVEEADFVVSLSATTGSSFCCGASSFFSSFFVAAMASIGVSFGVETTTLVRSTPVSGKEEKVFGIVSRREERWRWRRQQRQEI